MDSSETEHSANNPSPSQNDSSPISMLNEDCLAKIFSYLPFVDRVKVQRVCKRWQNVSQNNWHDFQRIRVLDPGDKLDTNSFRKLLQLCGNHLREVEFYASNTESVAVMGNLLKLVKEMCPNIQSLTFSRMTRWDVKYLADNFTNITKLAIYSCLQECEDDFHRFFKNNKNLKVLYLSNINITGKSLQGLSATTNFESLTLNGCLIRLNYFLRAMENLNKLSHISITANKDLCANAGRILESIKHKVDVKSIKISQAYFNLKKSVAFDFENFTNLNLLSLQGNCMINDDVLRSIGLYCKNLNSLEFAESNNISDDGLSYLNELPHLTELKLKNVNSIIDADNLILPKLNNLEIYKCPNVSNKFVSNVLKTSKVVRYINIDICQNISCDTVEDDLCKIVGSRADDEKLRVVIAQEAPPYQTRFIF